MKPMSKDATVNKASLSDANAAFLSKIRREKKASSKGRASTLKSIIKVIFPRIPCDVEVIDA